MNFDKLYLDFIRSKPCVICGRPAEAAHDDGGGMALKAHTLSAIPLCTKHHTQGEHKQGFKSFWASQRNSRGYYQNLMALLFFEEHIPKWRKFKRLGLYLWALKQVL